MRPAMAFAALLALAAVVLARPAGAQAGHDGGPSGAFSFASDPDLAATQRAAKAVVQAYQRGLNTGDFAVIRSLFALGAVAEWNGKATVIGPDAMAAPYAALFAEARFDTDFQYDAVDLYGDVAIVRTHHPIGQTELHLKDGTKTLDFNREVFVLHRAGAAWRIVLYTFTAQPRQGEQ